MNDYGFYIWAAYGISFATLAVLVWQTRRNWKRAVIRTCMGRDPCRSERPKGRRAPWRESLRGD
jgi:heme exporter protein CcmD